MTTDTQPPSAAAGGSETGRITFYELRYYMFSNFSAFQVQWLGRLWPTSEHAYQAMKFEDRGLQEAIRVQTSAHEAMKLAQSMPYRYRPEWNKVKVFTMEQICKAKLLQHKYIQSKLLETGDQELIESSPVDSFWGWGPNRDGQNQLGKVWMRLREWWKSQNTQVQQPAADAKQP